ncbi:MAG: zinc-ribbon domain-containing protein [Nitrospinae bacterium]|nr:zinc-ribbon domain-containing protein [Nitrospinota bacterium]
MRVSCPSCQKVLNIQDDKLPLGKQVKFACPFCKNPIHVTREEASEGETELPSMGMVPDTTPQFKLDETQNVPIPPPPSGKVELPDLGEALESELEILEEGAHRALVADTENLDRISPVLKKMNYLITTVKTADEALRKLQFNFYDLVIINERFNGADPASNPIHKFIEPMTMDIRRKMFVAIIGKNFRTLDRMTAFAKSANMVMNETDFPNFELILKKAIKDDETFFRLIKKTLVELGKD